jgi:hypothetical protein
MYTGSENHPRPECVVCGEKLCNESMVPGKLKRHFNTKHSHLIGKDSQFQSFALFPGKASQVNGKIATIAEKAQVASYKATEIIARNIQPHTIAETLSLPACKQIVISVLGEAAEREISNIPLSNDTISRRIENMSSDIQKQVAEKLYDGKKLSFQLDW